MTSLRTICAKTIQWGILGQLGGFTAQVRQAFRCQQSRQWQPYDQIRQNQLDKLRRLLRHAIANVPYYRRLHANGDLPDDIKDGSQMKRVPVLTKTIVQQEPEAFLAENVDRGQLLARRSGGSTGQVLEFFVSPPALAKSVGAEAWGDSLAGYRLGDPVASLWGARFDAATNRSLRERLAHYLTNRQTFVTDQVSSHILCETHSRLQRFRPNMLVGYVSSLVALSKYLLEHDQRCPGYPLGGIIGCAEPLELQSRQVIESAFDRPVFNRYGGREVGLIAMECDRHEGLHVNYEDLWVDLMETPQSPPGLASAVVTKLNEYGMPLIRYEMGDYASSQLGTCSCGRGYPTLAGVDGRTGALVRHPDGSMIRGGLFIKVLDRQPIRKYRVIQERDYSISIHFVPGDGYDDATEESIRLLLLPFLRDLRVSFHRCSDIPLTPSGKLLPVISHVAVSERRGQST
jgi:phenylacetate-CoA ligase